MTISKGRYATGVIVGSYRAGGLLDVSVEVTANHGGQRNLKGLKCSIYFPFASGHFTFKLCPVPAEAEATQQCMDNNVLGLAFSVMDMMLIIQLSTLPIIQNTTKYYLTDRRTGFFNLTLQLPQALTCRHCVLQVSIKLTDCS